MSAEQCLVVVKPDGMARGLHGDIIKELSSTDLKLVGAKMVQVTKELAEEHYQHLKDKEFFADLIKYIMGDFHHVASLLALVYEGENACTIIRDLTGATHPEEAHPTSIRGKYGRIHSGTGQFENVIHASENGSEAEREIKLWFRPSEITHHLYGVESRNTEIEEFFWK